MTDASFTVHLSPRMHQDLEAWGKKPPKSALGKLHTLFCDELLPKLADSNYALLPTFRCKKPLIDIRRIKKGRFRLYFIVNIDMQRVTVLMLGYRKAKDKHDAYEELKREMRRGTFDTQFEELNLPCPKV